MLLKHTSSGSWEVAFPSCSELDFPKDKMIGEAFSMHGPFREARQAVGITFLGFLGTQLSHVLERIWDHPYYLMLSEENLGQQSLGPVTGALPLLPRCHTTLGTAPPVLKSTVASTVGEISELENHHLVFLTNTEHMKKYTLLLSRNHRQYQEQSVWSVSPPTGTGCQILFSVTPE